MQSFWIIFINFNLLLRNYQIFSSEILADPKFSAPIANVTISVGREAVLTCKVHDLNSYKVAWLRVDTQTILTIQNHVITKNHRISIGQTEHRIWQLRIRDVRDTDRGWYMCQINTDPMKSQVGYLDVVVPPDIIDKETSHDIVVEEGHNATLICTATGLPPPIITWRREKEKPILASGNKEVYSIEGQFLFLPNVQRHQMGAYLCIASNGIPPTVSKRVLLVVNFAPTIWTPNEIMYAQPGQKILLECVSESYPTSVNYWLKDKEIIQGGTYESVTLENIFRIVMKLTIRPIKPEDFGEYKCVAKNSLGDSSKIITILERRREDVFLTARASEVIDGNNLANYQHDIYSSSSTQYSTMGLFNIFIILFFSISIV